MATEKVIVSDVRKPSSMKVVIVGGSIAGLVLAHSLHQAKIDYVVLEAWQDIAPQVGASIVLGPNGLRILDQLGLYEEVMKYANKLCNSVIWNLAGEGVFRDKAIELVGARFGYPPCFIQRRDLLKVLAECAPDKSKIQTSKRVNRIEHSDSGVTVFCEDGSSFEGDVVAGADGIHSAVVSQMRQHIEKQAPGLVDKDINGLSAEYKCIFGIANPVEGMSGVPGDCHRSYGKDRSTLTLIGDDRTIYFFLFQRLDKRYFGKEIPKYSKADMHRDVTKMYDVHLDSTVTFEMVWEKRTTAAMTPIEESQNQHWTRDRFVCLGDSAHKMTPNMGAGGNAAIESAAALTNSLARIESPKPSIDEIRSALKQFYTKRSVRADLTCVAANQLTRIEACSNLPNKLLAYYALPRLGNYLADLTSAAVVGAELLEILPVPAKAGSGTQSWDPEAGIGKEENKLVRALYALPILLMMYVCQRTMHAAVGPILPTLGAAAESGQLALGNGAVVPIRKDFFGVASVDSLLAVFVGIFTPSIGGLDAASRMQMIAFLADLVPIQAVWTIESIRRGNFLTAAHILPTVLGVWYQFRGIGYVAPLYYFLQYVQSPLENYAAADNRMTNVAYAKTILPSIAISYVLPTVAMFAAPSLGARQWINGVFWQPFPIYASLVHRLLASFVNDTTKDDQCTNPRSDLPYLRWAYRATAAVSAAAYLYVRLASPVPLRDVFFQGIRDPTAVGSLAASIAKSLRYDYLVAFSAGAMWIGLSFRDLKRAGKLRAGWAKIFGVFAGSTLFMGPGAAMATMWSWREETLAKKGGSVIEVEP
ncbi:MAG: hypothetical protein M1818_000015 [Claussenomyces sp. TS43310]|nr:MAG: hypothetical protein M1818_000015 [Claussenomyces sp. TS43310]